MADETTVAVNAAETLAEVPVVIAEQEAEVVKTEAVKVEQSWVAEVETWFADLRQNLQGLETETHNKLFEAKEALKVRLARIL